MEYLKSRIIPYLVICVLVGYIYLNRGSSETSTVVVYDTVKVFKPMPSKVTFDHYKTVFTDAKIPSIEVRTNVERVKVVNHNVYIPINKYLFETNDTKIYASGYNVTLDSVESIKKTKFVNRVTYRKRKWSLGITAGYGCTLIGDRVINGYSSKKVRFAPTIVVGLTYSLF